MARILAISLSKGGVGKTTTAVNLAAALATAGRRILLIDTDTQGQITKALGITPSFGLADFVEGRDVRECLDKARDNLFVLAGGRSLSALERLIARKDFRPESTIADAMAPLDAHFDYILLDTAPSWGALAVNVLVYARELLCPIQLEPLAVAGLLDFIERAQPIFSRMGGELRYVLPTMLDRRVNQTAEILSQVETAFGARVCQPIRANIRLSETAGHGQTIFEYAPNSRGAADYLQLAQRVMNDE